VGEILNKEAVAKTGSLLMSMVIGVALMVAENSRI
jgi:hypothetical protein